MSTNILGMGVATLLTIGLVVGLGVMSLLSGGLHFLFLRPRIKVLKSKNGETGFAFSHQWNSAAEPAKFNRVKVRLFNPFGTPTQVEVSHEYDAGSSNYARDVDFGPGFKQILDAANTDNASIEIECAATNDGIYHSKTMKAQDFLKAFQTAEASADHFNEEHGNKKAKVYYSTVQRNFIAEPLPKSGKQLKIATNPEFAGEFAAAGGGGGAAPAENFSVSKVWIDPGCIVCNACEGIYPEVFEVTADTCLIRPGAPLDDGLKILEAAEACPVEVIKFNKA